MVAGGGQDGRWTPRSNNLLRTVIDNGRLAALPEIAAQFQALVNARSGVSDATIYSAFPIDARAAGRGGGRAREALRPQAQRQRVELDPELIGGIRVVVGDEVLDTSVQGPPGTDEGSRSAA